MAYSLHDLKVTGPRLSKILCCRVEGRRGGHVSLTLHAYLEGNEASLYEMPAFQPVEVQLEGSSGNVTLFSGVVTQARLDSTWGVKTVVIYGKSYSWLMDLDKRSRSFQDPQMSFLTLAGCVMQGYPESALFYAAQERPIGKLMVQYQETDWEFLKRAMSMAGTAVTPYSSQAGVKLYIGIPSMPEREISYRVVQMEKDMDTYYSLKTKGYPVLAADFTRYQIVSEELAQMFEPVRVGGQLLIIDAFQYDFTGQELTCTYGLQLGGGLVEPAIYPMQLIGVALMGKIVRSEGDKVMVSLAIDQESGNMPACWFPYSTMSASPDGSGWYCMPETGDDVRVYFPSKHEEEAVALSAVSSYGAPAGGTDRMQDPNSRYLRTKDGQELALTPNFLRLSCAKGISSATIKNDGTVIINAQKIVKVKSDTNITIHAEDELTVHSKESLVLQSKKGGLISLEEGTLQFGGTEVTFD